MQFIVKKSTEAEVVRVVAMCKLLAETIKVSLNQAKILVESLDISGGFIVIDLGFGPVRKFTEFSNKSGLYGYTVTTNECV